MWGSIHIRRIVRVSQMLTRWRRKSCFNKFGRRSPPDVPPGHVAIIAAESDRRFVIRAKHLNHPLFRSLLSIAEDEFGFDHHDGPIRVPCDESTFEDILRVVTRSNRFPTLCRSVEALPLLRPERTLC